MTNVPVLHHGDELPRKPTTLATYDDFMAKKHILHYLDISEAEAINITMVPIAKGQ